MKRISKKLVSAVLVAAMLMSMAAVGISVSAATHAIEIFNGSAQVTAQVVMEESTSIQFNAQLIDCSMPDGSSIVWHSETPLIASVDQDGVVRAHDSSKGAALQLWIDNDVRTVPLVGKALASTLEGVFEAMDVDSMDTEEIVDKVEEYLGLLSESTAKKITDSLREQLNSLDVPITASLVASDGSVLATDEIRVRVTKSTAVTADFIPNGTFITNKESVPTTVEVGSSVALEGAVTPLRLKMGVSWTLSVDNILEKATDYASVDANGNVTFIKAGKVKVTASPNVDSFMDNIKKYVEYTKKINGNVDTDQLADVLINIVGININKTVLSYALKAMFSIDGDTLVWASSATATVANYLLKLKTNDSITFTILDNIQVESFEIGGTTAIEEGASEQLHVINVVPAGANINHVTWAIDDKTVANVSASGMLTGRDAGGSTSYNKKTTTVHATVDGVTADAGVTVSGKLITSPADIEITGPKIIGLNESAQFSYVVYPARSISSVTWGLVADDASEKFASSGSVSSSVASINSDGVVTGLAGGTVRLIAKTLTGVKAYYDVRVGTPVTGITIDQGSAVAVTVPTYLLYTTGSTQLSATVYPADATNKNIIWSVSNSEYASVENGLVKNKRIVACYVFVTATTEDGSYSATCVVSFSNYPVTGVSLDKSSMEIVVGTSSSLAATVSPKGTIGVGKASIEDVVWTSDNTSIATVDSSNGNVTAVAAGTCNVTVTTCDGLKTATCAVSVVANKTALNEVISLVESSDINENDYKPADIERLRTALADAKTARDEKYSSQESVNRAAQNLVDAFDALEIYVKLQSADIYYNGSPAPSHIAVAVGDWSLYTNNSIQLSSAITPSDAMYSAIVWSSDNELISVDQSGKCTPTKSSTAAQAKITLTVTDYVGQICKDEVYVVFARNQATGVSLNTTSITDALIGNTATLTATVQPDSILNGANIKSVTWSSSDPTVVSVDGGGNMTYVGEGSAVVTATTVDGGYTASCSITVSVNKTALKSALDTVNAAAPSREDYTDATYDVLVAALETANTVYSDPEANQAQVNSAASALNSAYSGLKKYIKLVGVSITKDGNDTGAFYSQSVSTAVTYSSTSVQFDAKLSPLDSMYTNVQWTSSSSSVNVDGSGKCTPSENKACYSTITVTVSDDRGNVVSDSVVVAFVLSPVTEVAMSPSSLRVSKNDAGATITATPKHVGTLININATIQTVIWSSSDESVATVDGNGKLTYHDAGVAEIYATSVDGGKVGVCSLVVGGDKTALIQAISEVEAMQINAQDYTYETSTAFTTAYNFAVSVRDGDAYSQAEIDTAKQDLLDKVAALAPYIHMTNLTITYNGSDAPDAIPTKVPYYTTISGKSTQLGYTYGPSDAMYSSISWSSSDGGINVDGSGKCTPAKNVACAAVITLTATDHYGNIMTDRVLVSFTNLPVTGVSLDQTSLTVNYGAANIQLNATVEPKDNSIGIGGANIQAVEWFTGDAQVATVSGSGLVTFVDSGTTNITVRTIDGGFTATCTVTVISDKTPLVETLAMLSGLALDSNNYTDDSWAVYAEKLAVAQDVVARDNPKQSLINKTNEELNAAYRALVRFYPLTGVTITRDGSVAPTHISVAVDLVSAYTNSKVYLGFNVSPANATYKSVVWKSSNSSVNFSDGTCTPAENKACYTLVTLTVTDVKGNVATDSVYVSFANYPVTGVSLNTSSITNAVNGSTGSLSATVAPEGLYGIGAASIKDIVWSSSDSSVVSVSGGTLNYKNTGSAVITATTVDGGHSASCTVTVLANRTSLQNAINRANGLARTDYTPESFADMASYLTEATAVFNKTNATQAETDAAAARLNALCDALVPFVYVSSVSILRGGADAGDNITFIVPSNEDYSAQSVALSSMILPDNAMYTEVKWSASGDVSVSESGVVTPSENSACYGTVTLTVTDVFLKVYTDSVLVVFAKTPATGITVSPTSVTTTLDGDDVQLTATVIGEGGAASDLSWVTWSSSNPAVASVTQTGLVDIVSGGIATITATSVVGGFKATCTITISTDKTALLAIINEVEAAGYVNNAYTNDSYQRLVTELAEAKAVYNNPDVDQAAIDAAVSELAAARSALVTYIVPTAITVTHDGSAAPTAISTKVPIYNTYSSKSTSLSFALSPSNAMYSSITWSVSGTNIEVSDSGVVKPSSNKAAGGIVTVTVTDYYGRTASDTVLVSFVNYQADGVSLDKSSLSMLLGGSATLSAKVTPDKTIGGASLKDVMWTSSDTSRVKVDGGGNVTAVDAGSAVITCTTYDRGYTASCTVTVTLDKTGLLTAINEASTFSSVLYTEESFAQFRAALAAARTVYNDANARSAEVTAALNNLKSAQTNLVCLPANYTDLNAAVAAAEALDSAHYTSESYNALMALVDAVDYGKSVLEQAQVDKMEKDILDAIDDLVFLPADYTELNAAYSQAGALLSTENYILSSTYTLRRVMLSVDFDKTVKEQSYVDDKTQELLDAIDLLELKPADYTALNAAVTKANAIDSDQCEEEPYEALMALVDSVDYTKKITEQGYVNTLTASINAAIDGMSYLPADYTELDAAVILASNTDDSLYTTESVKALDDAVASVEYGKDVREQRYVDTKTEQILAAINALEYLPADYTELDAVADAAIQYDEALYTEASYQALMALVDSIVYGKNITEQEELDDLTLAIHDAIAALKLKSSEVTVTPTENKPTTVIKEEEKIISGLTTELTSLDEFITVSNGSFRLAEGQGSGFIGTGTEIEILDEEGEKVDSFTAVIYGDLNGDGIVDSYDATLLNRRAALVGELDGWYAVAADLNGDGMVDSADATLLNRAAAKIAEIDQNIVR